MFSIELPSRAQDFLNKLDKHTRVRLEKRIKKLKDNPVPSDTKFIGRDNN